MVNIIKLSIKYIFMLNLYEPYFWHYYFVYKLSKI